jgi:hypothetical protein
MDSLNIKILQTVAQGLASLVNRVVFVGGIVTELYAERLASDEIRPTNDVDCVIEISSRIKYSEFETLLRSKGFQNDLSQEAPICRWLYKGIKVDIMPTDEEILGFSNKWYIEGIINKKKIALPNGTEIFIFFC